MSKQPEFLWDETTGVCSCQIFIDDFLQGFGIAECHPQDKDMMSRRTGEYIAELRAKINLLQNYKNRELRPQLKGYLHLKGTMINSPRYNPNSYEAKRLDKEIANIEKGIREISIAIEASKAHLYEYINSKEHMYQRIRKNNHEGYKEEDTERILNEINFYERVLKKSNDDTTT